MSDVYTLYSDFNCPFCYAMYERLHEMNLLNRCKWRGVQHAPHLSKPWRAGAAHRGRNCAMK
jgi:predicted DsbA family dithiol-disulfide isomerase